MKKENIEKVRRHFDGVEVEVVIAISNTRAEEFLASELMKDGLKKYEALLTVREGIKEEKKKRIKQLKKFINYSNKSNSWMKANKGVNHFEVLRREVAILSSYESIERARTLIRKLEL